MKIIARRHSLIVGIKKLEIKSVNYQHTREITLCILN